MKVIVIGSNGFVGSYVKNELSKAHKVFGATRHNDSDSIYVDLLDKKSIIAALLDVNPDVIVNCAGVVDKDEKSELNVEYTRNLIEAVNETGLKPKKIIISGSAAEYGVVNKLPVSELTALCADAGYGLSKRLETSLAIKLAKKYGLTIVIARIFNPIGIGMNPTLGVPKIAAQIHAIERGLGSKIAISRLDTKRDYLNIKDVALAIGALISGEPAEKVYNIGSGTSTTNGELVNLMIEYSKLIKRPQIVETQHYPEPTLASQADISRIQNEFGWNPEISIQDSIKEIMHAAK